MKPLNVAEKALLRARVAAEQGDWWTCLEASDECLQHNPAAAEAYFMAGRAAMSSKLNGIATQFFHMGTKIAPDAAAMWNNLGVTLQERDDEGAYKAFRRAHMLDPSMTAAMSSLTATCQSLGRWAEAMEWAEKCLAVDPDMPDVVYNQSLVLLAMGRWAEAWPKYNAVLGIADRLVRNYHGAKETPRWSPDVKGGKCVIYGEQGIGDEVMFAAMLPAAIAAMKANGTAVVLETAPRLEGLWRRAFPEAAVYGTRGQQVCEWVLHEEPTHRLEMGGLGEFFAPEPIRAGAYLKADAAKRAMARAWLSAVAPGAKMRVGIAWTGGIWATGRRKRSLPVETLGPLFALPGIEWVCLEYDDPRDALETIKAEFGVTVHDPRSLVGRGADYDDTAALVNELDLVIAPTTSAVDLCGALGKPVWAFVPHTPQWRYAEAAGEDRMFWYESARVFRQKEPGQWGQPVVRAAHALKLEFDRWAHSKMRELECAPVEQGAWRSC